MVDREFEALDIGSAAHLQSPALIVDPAKICRNIDAMIDTVGGSDCVDRLRPHLKTHKMSEVVRLQRDAGITKFKAATLAEVAMALNAGGADVMLAHQLVGPKIQKFAQLREMHPGAQVSTIVDNQHTMRQLAADVGSETFPLVVFADVDCGMHRTGVAWGNDLLELCQQVARTPGLRFGGIHVYDGHLHDHLLLDRHRKTMQIVEAVSRFEDQCACPVVVAGGSPTFGIWASQTEYECSPGTTLLWDVGYGRSYEDLQYEIAAALVARVISKPQPGHVCLDLGHKAIASEMPLAQRVVFPAIADAQLVSQSEEHLVVRTAQADQLHCGDAIVGLPTHICPTVAVHATVSIVCDNKVTQQTWRVVARDR